MLQIMLTDYCNQACPYCFAKEKLKSSATTELSLSDVDYLIDLHREWGLPHMSLAGGEPTLHSHFEDVVTRIEAAGFPSCVSGWPTPSTTTTVRPSIGS